MKHTNRELPTLSKLGKVLDHSRGSSCCVVGLMYSPTHSSTPATETSLQLQDCGRCGKLLARMLQADSTCQFCEHCANAVCDACTHLQNRPMKS